MLTRSLRLCALLFITLLAACAGAPVDPNDTQRSVIFGYIDMEGAPTDVDWVFIQHYDGTTDGYSVGANDGLFYHVGVPTGPYQVTKFGGSGFFAGEVVYNFPDEGRNDTATIVDQPGAYFVGSFGYDKVKTGLFQQKQFDIQPTDSPGEAEVLQDLLKLMRKHNPEYRHAISLVEQRMTALN